MNDTSSPHPRTLFAKIWDAHAISEEPGQGALLYIDRHMLNEVTTPQPFASLRAAGRRVRQPKATFGLVDHSIPTTPIGTYGRRSNVPVLEASRATQIAVMERNAREFGVVYFGIDDPRNGIEHVSAPEQGITLPGMTMGCGDSVPPKILRCLSWDRSAPMRVPATASNSLAHPSELSRWRVA